LEQQNIKELFELFHQLFRVFDCNETGVVPKADLHVLKPLGLLSEGGVKRLGERGTAKEGVTDFKEFVAFFCSEYVRREFEVGQYSRNLEDDQIPEKYAKSLAPLVFRLSARHLALQRIFGLFKKMFDVFDVKNKGSISKEELSKLREQDMLDQKEIDQLMSWDTSRKGNINFEEFLAFWVSHFIESSLDNEKEGEKKGETTQTKDAQLESIALHLRIDRPALKRSMQSVNSLFTLLDDKKTGEIAVKDLVSLLQKEKFLDEVASKALMSAKTKKEGLITVSEFLFWLTLYLMNEK